MSNNDDFDLDDLLMGVDNVEDEDDDETEDAIRDEIEDESMDESSLSSSLSSTSSAPSAPSAPSANVPNSPTTISPTSIPQPTPEQLAEIAELEQLKEAVKKAGRPTVYKPEFDEIAQNACLLFGATDEQLAELLGVSVRTIYYWKLHHPTFLQATKEGKQIADGRVARTLYNDAITPGQTTAQIFWLKNRRPDSWRDRHNVSIDDPAQVLADTLGIPVDQLPE